MNVFERIMLFLYMVFWWLPLIVMYLIIHSLLERFDPIVEMKLPDEDNGHTITKRTVYTRKIFGGIDGHYEITETHPK